MTKNRLKKFFFPSLNRFFLIRLFAVALITFVLLKVKDGYVFVVGDNRRMEMSRHKFGQTPKSRIAGAPLW